MLVGLLSFQYANLLCADRRVKIRHVAMWHNTKIYTHTHTNTLTYLSVVNINRWNTNHFRRCAEEKKIDNAKVLKNYLKFAVASICALFFPRTSLTRLFARTRFFFHGQWKCREKQRGKKNRNCITQRIYIFIIPICMNHFLCRFFICCAMAVAFHPRLFFFRWLWFNLFFQGAYNPMNYFPVMLLVCLRLFASFITTSFICASHRESMEINRA